ncbi:hypothetical protein HGO37_19415 [Rhizobium sp. CG4]|uniref:hypothetical protein n=1 Tax=Rhizobium sp. CG4 TaxID=2726075 RepID=UPI0020344FCB|nr:hypothetical protein [Rhizobium sp. CG4]MCM2457573.1 hypothetical protein [Rhizobium sp. CG4]
MSEWIQPDTFQVGKLLQTYSLATPVFVRYERLDFKPGHPYEAVQCHINAKHVAKAHGGDRIHGWALWIHTKTGAVMGDFHSVWKKEDGTLVDVTPPRDGGQRILFVEDKTATIARKANQLEVRSNLIDFESYQHDGQGTNNGKTFLKGGQPSRKRTFNLPQREKKEAYSYAQKIGFDIDEYPTD